MQRVSDPAQQLHWLIETAGEAEVTGYDLSGWPASTWILHAMYRNPSLDDLGTWDDHHERRYRGDRTPLVVDGIDLEYGTDPDGNEVSDFKRPGPAWHRVPWSDYIDNGPGKGVDCGYPPCFQWFRDRESWPVAVRGGCEGSLDEESFSALIEVLASQSPNGEQTECHAYVSQMAANDFESEHLYRGPLSSLSQLVADFGGPYWSTPSNFWAADRSWFVWTDYDLEGTKVSGTTELIDSIYVDVRLEAISWP